MKKLLLLFTIFFLAAGKLSAQRDTEHWIAPFYESTSYTGRSLYLSTDSVTPFAVTIYSNNASSVPTVIGTVTISKGSPQIFVVPQANIAANNASDGFTKINKGLYLNASKPFYCTLRIASSTTHAEIVTSKGKAGIGKEFYVAATPSPFTNSGNNFTAGVMATENNTTITATWNPGVTFITNNAPTTTTHTFVLNKGESFIFAGSGSPASNMSSFIGAKIVSDKPITLTNGNVNGNFGTGTSDGSDAVLDQSVPVERLGNTFAMVRTRSTDADVEGGLIIATEDNTQIFLNGSATPAATINQGQWYRISGSSYIVQGGGTHANMFISTSKNVYLYQFVAVNNSNATCGFNYIPPLNCFLPRKIDEIGKINEMPSGTGGTSVVATGTIIKLNILTEAGAVVTVNGTAPLATDGPFPLTGNTNWVTYGISGVTNNITVVSDKAVTAGINGGYSTSGYGGYFAGFSSIPVISKQTGECIPGIVLELDSGFDTYQWYLNGVAIPGATSNTYTPTVAGNYTCKVSVGSCTPVTTPIYKVFTCLKKTTTNLAACAAVTITPTFSSSTQTPVPSTVTIVTPPSHGTAVVNPTTGVIVYTPTAGYIGPDTLVYQFCGNAPEFVDCEQVTVNFTAIPFPVVQDATLSSCFIPENPATAQFDLTTAVVTLQSPVTKKYYPSVTDANNDTNMIPNPLTYISPSTDVYVRVYNSGGCYRIAKITLIVKPPKKSAILVDKYICAEDTTTLDAGPGYTSYLWSTGATTPSISNVSVGTYSVILTSDGCPTVQTVTVHKVPNPVVTNIEINNNSVTLTVTGGTPPYKYSLDNVIWQDSNIFNNLPRGQNTFYIKDKFDCDPVIVEITVPNLVNVITPNGDGVNDYVDYSALAYKSDLIFSIYDRYGNKVHVADKANNYKWDGKFSDKKVHTGTYWYHINWTEPDAAKTPVKFSGWILVKNRE